MEVQWFGVETPKLGSPHRAVCLIFSIVLGNAPLLIFSTLLMSLPMCIMEFKDVVASPYLPDLLFLLT